MTASNSRRGDHEDVARPADARSLRVRRSLRWIVAVTTIASIVMWLVVAGALHSQRGDYRDELARTLTETNSAVAAFIEAWITEQEAVFDLVVSDGEVADAMEALMAAEPGALPWQVALHRLTVELGPLLISELGYDYAVVDSNGTIVHSSSGESGTVDLPSEPTGATFDFTRLSSASSAEGPSADGPVTTRVWKPVVADGTFIGWLGLERDVSPVARLLSAAIGPTESQEVYIFDGEGRLLTPSRFERQLASTGLLGPGETSIGLVLHDPGRNLLDEPGSVGTHLPLTRMAADAVDGGSGVDTEGYRDYRGVTVVGAWQWIEPLRIGVATEIDAAEAFASFERMLLTWLVATGALTGVIVVLAGIAAVTDHRLRRANQRLIRLTEHLDDEVQVHTAELEASRETLRAEVVARTELLAAVSHELRTPLTSVLGFSSLLAEETDSLDPHHARLVDLIRQEASEMADLVEDLLTSVRVSTGSLRLELQPVELAGATSALLASWDPAERRRVTFDASGAVAYADPLRVRQVLRNLLTNAMRYGGSGVLVATRAEGTDAVLEVADDGPPIPADTQMTMFEMYSRGQSEAGPAPSIGVGLALSQRLIESMGGSLVLTRSEGLNRFIARFPTAALAAATSGETRVEPQPTRFTYMSSS